MAFTNSITPFLSGIMQYDYAGSSVGNTLTSGTAVTLTVAGTTAIQGTTVYLIHGMFRLKLYAVTGTSPTWQFNVYANSATTGELLFQSPAYSVGTSLTVDISHIFQTETAVTSFVIIPTGGGTSPTGTLDFEYAGSQ